MNAFFRRLSDSIFKMLRVEAEVFVSKRKKKIVHVVFDRPLMFYNFFYELIDFIEHF